MGIEPILVWGYVILVYSLGMFTTTTIVFDISDNVFTDKTEDERRAIAFGMGLAWPATIILTVLYGLWCKINPIAGNTSNLAMATFRGFKSLFRRMRVKKNDK